MDEIILQRFVEIERNIRDIQEDIREYKNDILDLYNQLDSLKHDTENNIDNSTRDLETNLNRNKSRLDKIEMNLYNLGRAFRDTFSG